MLWAACCCCCCCESTFTYRVRVVVWSDQGRSRRPPPPSTTPSTKERSRRRRLLQALAGARFNVAPAFAFCFHAVVVVDCLDRRDEVFIFKLEIKNLSIFFLLRRVPLLLTISTIKVLCWQFPFLVQLVRLLFNCVAFRRERERGRESVWGSSGSMRVLKKDWERERERSFAWKEFSFVSSKTRSRNRFPREKRFKTFFKSKLKLRKNWRW